MNLLLTSCGLETEEITQTFISMLPKAASEIKAVFIPTAAVFPDAIEVLPMCLEDLLKVGILKENIVVYDLHKFMKISEYDVVYLCGGDPAYLLERINEVDFGDELRDFIKNDGVVVGVSAGSIVFADNMENNLDFLPCKLEVHCDKESCEEDGILDMTKKSCIKLGNEQAIIFKDEAIVIIG